jgi:molybdenum cofactor cytidylyltransferase
LKIGEVIIPEAIARVLNHPAGGLKNIPVLARRIALLNQADTPEVQAQARLISSQLIPSYQSAIIASLKPVIGSSQITPEPISQRSTEIYAVYDQVAGIILAAGESSRFGAPKQLLIWRGIPFIRHVAMIALEAGLSPVVVIVGASAETIQKVISDLPVRIVNNLDWESGQSSSIKAGVSGLSRDIGAAIFLMADQPQIPTNLIRYLVETHQITLAPIIAPQSDGQRGNPVLFDSTTFPQLLLLSGDSGGRSLFAHYPVQWVPWHDSRILLDVDTPEAYEKFLEIFPEGEGN